MTTKNKSDGNSYGGSRGCENGSGWRSLPPSRNFRVGPPQRRRQRQLRRQAAGWGNWKTKRDPSLLRWLGITTKDESNGDDYGKGDAKDKATAIATAWLRLGLRMRLIL
jgi:hypothetical protein